MAAGAPLPQGRYPVLEDVDWLPRVLNRIASTFTIVVIGQVGSGKSSFINSLLGRQLVISSDRPTDGVISALLPLREQEDEEYAELIDLRGRPRRVALMDGVRFLSQQETSRRDQQGVAEVRLHLGDPLLHRLRLVGTPGFGDRLVSYEQVVLRYLRQEESDLVVWTFTPDAAANEDEIGIFSRALDDRKGAILGVVTHCLDGREDDPAYDPRGDDELAGDGGVAGALRRHLGYYLKDVVLYDSHEARPLVERLRRDPDLRSDADFSRQLERCGYAHFMRAFEGIVLDEPGAAERERTRLVLQRCSGSADRLGEAAAGARDVFRSAAAAQARVAADWAEVEAGTVAANRARLETRLREMARERSNQFVTVTGGAAARAVVEHFHLFETLFRFAGDKVGWTRGPGEDLQDEIEAAMEAALEKSNFRAVAAAECQRVVTEQLEALVRELGVAGGLDPAAVTDQVADIADRARSVLEEFTLSESSSRAPDNVAAATAGHTAVAAGTEAIKQAAASAARKAAAKTAADAAAKAAAEAARQTATEAAKNVATEVAGQTAATAGKQTLRATAVAAVAKVVSVASVATAPADALKIWNDFKESRGRLGELIKQHYLDERPTWEHRFHDALWPIAKGSLDGVLLAPRERIERVRDDHARLEAAARDAEGCRERLQALAWGFERTAQE